MIDWLIVIHVVVVMNLTLLCTFVIPMPAHLSADDATTPHASASSAASLAPVTGRAGGVTVSLPTNLPPLHWLTSLTTRNQRAVSHSDDDNSHQPYERIV